MHHSLKGWLLQYLTCRIVFAIIRWGNKEMRILVKYEWVTRKNYQDQHPIKNVLFFYYWVTVTHHFLKIDHIVNKCLVALVCERHVWKEMMKSQWPPCPFHDSFPLWHRWLMCSHKDLYIFPASRTFEKQRHEGDDWRVQFGNSESVGPVVSGRVLSPNIWTEALHDT